MLVHATLAETVLTLQHVERGVIDMGSFLLDEAGPK